MGNPSQTGKGLRFIPWRKSDLIRMLLDEESLGAEQQKAFLRVCELLQSIYHFEYHRKLEGLKDAYAPLNPDRDTLPCPIGYSPPELSLSQQLQLILDKANYEALPRAALQEAFTESSLFKLRLHIDFTDFSEALLFTRGERIKREQVTSWFGLRRKTVEFANFERVVIYLEYADGVGDDENRQAGSVMLKLFRNVPRADIEMLFPNTQLRMRVLDKLFIGVPAVAGGVAMFTTKAGASLLLLGALLGYWLGLSSEPVQLNQATLLALLAGLGALGSFTWKQFNNFRNRKLSFMKSLTESLYFRNLDNNAGVFHRLIDDAEEEECKEALLAYYFLLTRDDIGTSQELDRSIEQWFRERWNRVLDFEVGDALAKLVDLELVRDDQPLASVDLEQAITRLGQRWDDYF